MKRALITGITGQDGSYLAEFLLEKGYEVHGLVRRVALEDQSVRFGRIKHILDRLKIHTGDITIPYDIATIFQASKPDEVYHLAAQSYVALSFESPLHTLVVNVVGTALVLDHIHKCYPDCRMYFAGSSEMFGHAKESPQNEATPFYPRSPYAVSKVAGFDLTRNYRESYDLFLCSGIMFNHDSPRRGMEFVTRKITSTVAKIAKGQAVELRLGNLEAKRDWGYCADYIEAMWLMLQHDTPDDYVIATGVSHTVKEFARYAFDHVGLDADDYVIVDPQLCRPAEVDTLCGDYSKAKRILGWEPKVEVPDLVKMMVDEDMRKLEFGE